MAEKSAQLDRDIAESLSRKVSLPHWNGRKGWVGGDSRTLYAFTDKSMGRVEVYPGGSPSHVHVGPEATVRLATRAEAERLWQSPLHVGWKVAP